MPPLFVAKVPGGAWRKKARDEAVVQSFHVGAPSRFVTAVAWCLIVLALACAATFLGLSLSVDALASGSRMPIWTQGWMPQGASPVVSGCAVAAVAVLSTAVGLLRRHNWARILMIGLLGFALVANLAGLWLQQEVVQSVVNSTLRQVTLPAAAHDVFSGFVVTSRILAAALTLACCVLLAWVIARLMSAQVRREFV
jgi:hypothetical protein